MRKTQRADGRYFARVYLGKKEGNSVFKYFYADRQKDANRLAEEYKASIGKGLDPDRAGSTFGNIYDALVAARRAKGIGEKSLRSFASIRNHFALLLPRPADSLHSADFQQLLNALAEWHDGKPPLSHRTLSEIHAKASAAYKLAIPEVVQFNPLDKVVIPQGQPAKKRNPLTDTQQQLVLTVPHRAQRAAMLLLYSGLRRGEATALTWPDIDLDAGEIRVNKAMELATMRTKPPKTESGTRTVNIPRRLIDYLRTQQDGCLYVLHNAKGRPYTETAWRRLWESYMATLNAAAQGKSPFDPHGLPQVIEPFTPHQLRHTFCTMLYLAGIDVMTARDQMGHSSITVTMEIYTHLDKQYKRHSMDKLDSFLDTGCVKGVSNS